jgi:hypothetical protein
MFVDPPFSSDLAIDAHIIQQTKVHGNLTSLDHVPDQPNVQLQPDTVRTFLQMELETTILDRMYDWLWLCAAKDSQRIDPLHQQVFKGRAIIPMEDPALHLIWFTDNICIKPVPLDLLNHDFWMLYLNGKDNQFDRKIVLGFLRSYRYLVRHPSDFKIAMDRGLILPTTTWLQWTQFIENSKSLGDAEVANRYHFGQIRLSQLNILIRFLRPRLSTEIGNNRHYYTTHWFTAVSMSLLLSAMQVILSLPTDINTRTWVKETASLSFASWGFCVMVLVLLLLSWLMLLVAPIFYITAQPVFGYYQKKDFEKIMATAGQA